jgi:hypothetical protein
MLPRRIEAELIIESDHAVNIYIWYIKEAGNFQHRFSRQIAKLALNLL